SPEYFVPVPPAAPKIVGGARWAARMERLSDSHALGFLAPLVLLAFVRIEELLAQANRFGRHFDQLVILDIGERLFQRHADRRGEPGRLVLWVRAGIGGLLSLGAGELQVV